MNAAERTSGPALGNALGYFAALYLMAEVEWISAQNPDPAIITAMMGTIFIHLFLEVRAIGSWIMSWFK